MAFRLHDVKKALYFCQTSNFRLKMGAKCSSAHESDSESVSVFFSTNTYHGSTRRGNRRRRKKARRKRMKQRKRGRKRTKQRKRRRKRTTRRKRRRKKRKKPVEAVPHDTYGFRTKISSYDHSSNSSNRSKTNERNNGNQSNKCVDSFSPCNSSSLQSLENNSSNNRPRMSTGSISYRSNIYRPIQLWLICRGVVSAYAQRVIFYFTFTIMVVGCCFYLCVCRLL